MPWLLLLSRLYSALVSLGSLKGENGKNNLIALSIIPAKMHSIFHDIPKLLFLNSNFSLISFNAVLMERRLAEETIFMSYDDKLAFYWLPFLTTRKVFINFTNFTFEIKLEIS